VISVVVESQNSFLIQKQFADLCVLISYFTVHPFIQTKKRTFYTIAIYGVEIRTVDYR